MVKLMMSVSNRGFPIMTVSGSIAGIYFLLDWLLLCLLTFNVVVTALYTVDSLLYTQ